MTKINKFSKPGIAQAILMAAGLAGRERAQASPASSNTGAQTATEKSKF